MISDRVGDGGRTNGSGAACEGNGNTDDRLVLSRLLPSTDDSRRGIDTTEGEPARDRAGETDRRGSRSSVECRVRVTRRSRSRSSARDADDGASEAGIDGAANGDRPGDSEAWMPFGIVRDRFSEGSAGPASGSSWIARPRFRLPLRATPPVVASELPLSHEKPRLSAPNRPGDAGAGGESSAMSSE